MRGKMIIAAAVAGAAAILAAAGVLGVWSLVYLAFACAAFAMTWGSSEPDADLRLVGAALAVSWLLSNAWSVTMPKAPHELKATLYTVIEIAVALTAMGVTLHRLCWLMIAVVSVAAFSCSANVIYAITPSPAWSQTHLHEVSTNICFALECVLAVWAGWRIRRERAGGIGEFNRPSRYRLDPQFDGSPSSPARAPARK
jgi:hypothetical protein